MDKSEQFLIIKIVNINKNENCKCEILLNQMESIEKIKEDCKQKLGFEDLDINKINLYFVDDDKDKIIINEFNDLIEHSNINSENDNLSIDLIMKISEEKGNQNKENNPIYINKNNGIKIINDDKDRKINELKTENEILKMICKRYKDKLKELIDKYEIKIRNLKNVDSKKENIKNLNL